MEDELTELLRRRRKVLNEKPDNFAIFGTDTLHAAVGPDYRRAVSAAVLRCRAWRCWWAAWA